MVDEKILPDLILEQYREMFEKALAYLAKQQYKDGHWEGDDGQHPGEDGWLGLHCSWKKIPVSPRSRCLRKWSTHPTFAKPRTG